MTKLRLLLVEDSAIIREALLGTLASDGLFETIDSASSEQAAKDLIANSRPFDAAIVDLRLAEGSGLGVIQALRASTSKNAYVIVLTNYVIPAFRRAAQQAGADEFLDKSKDFMRIAPLIRQRYQLS